MRSFICIRILHSPARDRAMSCSVFACLKPRSFAHGLLACRLRARAQRSSAGSGAALAESVEAAAGSAPASASAAAAVAAAAGGGGTSAGATASGGAEVRACSISCPSQPGDDLNIYAIPSRSLWARCGLTYLLRAAGACQFNCTCQRWRRLIFCYCLAADYSRERDRDRGRSRERRGSGYR